MSLNDFYSRVAQESPSMCEGCPMAGNASGPIRGTAVYGDTGTGDVMDLFNGHSELLVMPRQHNPSEILDAIKHCVQPQTVEALTGEKVSCPALSELRASRLDKIRYNLFWTRMIRGKN